MQHTPPHDLNFVADLFNMRADLMHAAPYGNGHINDTYAAEYDQAGRRLRYIHQRINTSIFQDPESLMNNIRRVTEHSFHHLKARGCPEAFRRTLTLIPAKDGLPYAIDSDGNYWRTYPFIERARTYDKIENENQAQSAAAAFGNFQMLASSIPGERLTETIPDFHHTPKRLEKLHRAVELDSKGRASEVNAELDFIMERETDAGKIVTLLETGKIPERVTHNDTKLNNVMLDDISSEGVCVIDLDTVMPGSALYDFSDMVRTATSTAAEDEQDLNKVRMNLSMFQALVTGYLSTAKAFLNSVEIQHLASTAKLMVLECGVRFLTDYLEGDHYFKIHRPKHNLDRARNQFALVKSIEAQLPEMEACVEQCLAGQITR